MAQVTDEVDLELQDPKGMEPKPPFPKQHQPPPGSEQKMEPKPDFGEQTYKGSNRLQGRKALITGADSGIGRAVALAFAREGADVLISYLNEEEDAKETERLVTGSGRKAIRVAGDIGSEQHCQQLVQKAVREFGQIDLLVNNAAFQMVRQSIEQVPSEEFDRTFKTNIYSMFYLSKAAVPHMKPGAAIINTASIEAYKPNAGLLAYSATKGAIATFTKALSEELIKKGIRVNAVAPGPVWTPLIPSSMPEQHIEKFGGDTPIQRAAQPAELAPVYVFLASNEASYVVGQIYGVTGGEFIA